MKYLIDGYNLIGEIHKISFEDPEKEKKLVEFLVKRKGKQKDRFEIIFDGRNPYFELGYKESVLGVETRYTAHGETADEVIIEKIKQIKSKKNTIVVTTDNQIRHAAKVNHIKCVTSEQFLKLYQPEIETKPDKPQESSDADVSFWMDQFEG